MPISTNSLVGAFQINTQRAPFFLSFATTPEFNYFNTRSVVIQVMRDGQEISIPLGSLLASSHMNSADKWNDKAFVPPYLSEETLISAEHMLDQQFGSHPWQNPDFQAQVALGLARQFPMLTSKMTRTKNLQVAQLLQSGVVTLLNTDGVAVWTLDYQARTAHFPTVSTLWDAASPDMIGDIDSVGQLIVDNSGLEPDQLVMGTAALKLFKNNAAVQARLDNRRTEGSNFVAPELRNGGTYHGRFSTDLHTFELWSYNQKYKHPQTAAATPYMDPNKVIIRSSQQRIHGAFGAVPNVAPPRAELLDFLPSNARMRDSQMDLYPHIYASDNGKQLIGGLSERPVYYPVEIDGHGCITVLS